MQIPRLREWRERRALTQVELAERAGISARSVAGYEAGNGARLPTVRRLAAALDVEVTDLYGVPEHPLGAAPPSQQLTLNGALEEERRTVWESAVENARRLRDDGQAQMWKALSGWRTSKQRREPDAARREYLDEMGNLLQEVYDAETVLQQAFLEAALTEGDSEASGPRLLRDESRRTGHFYGELRNLVESAKLHVLTGADATAAKTRAAETEAERPHSVEDPDAA